MASAALVRDLLRESRLPWESFESAVANLADDPPAAARAFLDGGLLRMAMTCYDHVCVSLFRRRLLIPFHVPPCRR